MGKVSCHFISQPVFPTLIGIYNFVETNHSLNCNLIDDILEEHQLDTEGEISSNVDGWHSKSGLEKKYESFDKLRSIIEESARHYCDFYGYHSNVICEDLWANLNKEHNYNVIHHHGVSYLTGVYYPAKYLNGNIPTFNYTKDEVSLLNPGIHTENKKNEGSLYFLNPSYAQNRTLYKKTINDYTTDAYHIYPTSSVLLIFPSHLLHAVNPFSGNNTRISVSFVLNYNE